jgi:hypothetical protein
MSFWRGRVNVTGLGEAWLRLLNSDRRAASVSYSFLRAC